MITIYHLGVSQSDRIVWLMEELGLPYQLEWFDRGPDQLAPPEYVALHPAAMAPVIRDGDTVLAESTAIVQYIAHVHGHDRFTVAPTDPRYADYLYWLQFNNNAQAGYFVKAALAEVGAANSDGSISRVTARRTEGLFRQMNDHLATHSYLAGSEFTLADLMSGFAVTTLPRLVGDTTTDQYPNIKRYAQRLMDRPAWQRAMDVAGPQAKRPNTSSSNEA